jgi:transcriptional regulator with XRE-family HTH domain
MSRVDDATSEISEVDEGPTACAAPFLKGPDSATAWIAADLQRAPFMSTPAFKVSDAPVTLARLLQIGRRFQEMRSLHGLSLSETAVRLGMPATRLSLIEAGERRPFLQELAQASREFAISTDYLLGLSENDDPGATTVERIAVLRHIEHLMSQQADRIVSAAREELRDGAAHAAYTRDVVNAAGRVIAAAAPLAKGRNAAPREFLAAVATLSEVTAVAQQWLDRQDRLAQRVIAKATEQLSPSVTTFQPEQS